jgi:hypothetical protein
MSFDQNGRIFKWVGDLWIRVERALRQISATSDGTLWGVTPDLRLVRIPSFAIIIRSVHGRVDSTF